MPISFSLRHYRYCARQLDMYAKLYFLLFLAVLSAPIKCDEIDDAIERGIEEINQLTADTKKKINDGLSLVINTDSFYDHTVLTFSSEGEELVNASKIAITEEAERLTEQAIQNNKPASVIACIANAETDALNNLDGAFEKLETDLDDGRNKGESVFPEVNKSLNLILTALPSIQDTAIDRILTCVSEVCVENNLEPVRKEYETSNNNVATEVQKVKDARLNFNKASAEALDNTRNSVSDIQTKAIKKMGKC